MFGGWNGEVAQLNSGVDEMFIGPFGSALKNESFVPKEASFCMVYEQKHAIEQSLKVPTRYVNHEKYEELKRFTILPGDIIVSCRGTVGKMFVIPEEAPLGIMHPSIMKIRLKRNVYDELFFRFMLRDFLDRREHENNGSSVKMAITASKLGLEEFPRPPLTLQLAFRSRVEAIDKSKFAIRKSLDKLNRLYRSLLQQYFG